MGEALSSKDVPLGLGPPTMEEMIIYYPGKFTWTQLKTFINAGDLGLLKRDKNLQQRYWAWSDRIKSEYGSMVKYLITHRLRWGEPDRISLMPSARVFSASKHAPNQEHTAKISDSDLPLLPDDAPPYFTVDIPSDLICITQNDWPYSVPSEIEHTLVWTRVPIFHPALVPEKISARVQQDGLWGFTGSSSPPPSPSTLPSCLPALAEWGTTLDGLVRSEKGTEEEEEMVGQAGREIDLFVRKIWPENEWETAWFVNPPRLQSIPGLSHFHVFARHKSPAEIANQH